MAFNQLIRITAGQAVSAQNTGSIVAGISNLSGKSSTGICGVCVDFSGNIFVTDQVAHIVLKIDRTGTISTYAGVSGSEGSNGDDTVTAYNARFSSPQGICCDRSGNLYVADTGNNQIRKIDLNRNVSLLAGDPDGTGGFADGANISAALFNEPHGVAVNRTGVVYVADGNNHSIRMVVGANVYTLAGNGTSGDAEGQGTVARFNHPYGVTVDPSGRVFVSDSGNHRIKVINTDGNVYEFSGDGTSGTTLGTAATSRYQTPKFIDTDRSGNLYLIDWSSGTSSRLLRINQNGIPGVIIDFSGAEDAYVIGVAIDQAEAIYVAESVADLLISSSSSVSSSTFVSVTSSSSSSSKSSSTGSSSTMSASSSSGSSESSST
jgi:sugar lactone lactonase YvrE